MSSVAIWILLAFSLGLVVRQAGLPPLIGYLVAGFALSSYGLQPTPLLHEIAHAGVLLLLFSVGLKLRLKSLFRVEVLSGALLHMVINSALLLGLLLAFQDLDLYAALLLAFALSFSSTVVAAKVLEQKKELRAFHGRLAIGILVVQDLLAVGFLSLLGSATPSPWIFGLLALPLLRPVLFYLMDHSGHEELLLLFGLLVALVLGGAGFQQLGLSAELGALIMGVVLASHARSSELSDTLWSLKEVFLVGFFLLIGMSGQPDLESFGIALLLTLLLPVKAALFFAILLLFRLRARTSLLAGLSLATYSEFGLIVTQFGVQQGWLDTRWLVLLAISVALSFVVAAPLNRIAHDLYARLEHLLQRFETEQRHPDDEPIHLGNSHLLIMGMGRVGTGAYDFLTQRQQRVAGLDSDPGKVEHHRKAGRRVLYADAEDPGLWHNLDMHGIQAVLLAMPDVEANTIATSELRRKGFTGLISATVMYSDQAEMIREAGADVVYNYFDEVGVGFAEHVWEQLFPAAPVDSAS